jgi:prefoldin alpha subunit|tara:strand:+ start:2729 stop:3151 length:423 start_codon:yes stop_codon:yes gene_type:complete
LSAEQQAQAMIQQMRMLESYLEEINNRENISIKAIIESKAASKATENLEKANFEDILFPIGSGLLIKLGKTPTFLVNIGAGITIEKNAEEVKEFLDTRIKDIEEAMKTLTVQKNEMTQQYNSIRTALNTIVQGQQNVRQN